MVNEIPQKLPEPVEAIKDMITSCYITPEGQITVYLNGGGMAVYTPEGFSNGDPDFAPFEGKLAYRWEDGSYVPDG